MASKAYAYILREGEFQWNWNLNENSVRIQIRKNQSRNNETLLDLAGILALLIDGYIGANRWLPQSVVTPKYPSPSFHVGVEIQPDPSLFHDHALYTEATLSVTQSPVGEPTIHIFNQTKDFLDFADRISTLMVISSFSWVEIRWTSSQLSKLKSQLNAKLDASRP